jgi:uncharacterized membrane protein YbhN (UPF0104 family)
MTSPPTRQAPLSPAIWNFLKIALALGLTFAIISKVDLPRLVLVFAHISPAWLLLSALFYILLTLLKGLQYYFLIGRKVQYPEVLNIVVVQNAISNFVATSAGIASYLSLFRMEHSVKLSRVTLAFILTKVGDLISIWLFMLIAGVWVWPQVAPMHALTRTLLASIGVVILTFFAAVILRQKFVSALRALSGWLGLHRIGIVTRMLNGMQDMVELEQSFIFRMIGIGILYSIIYLLITIAWVYASLQTFSLEIGFIPVTFVNTFTQLISYLPIQVFGGLGVGEMTYLYMYGFFDLTQAEIAPVLIGTRMLFYFLNLLVLIYLPVHAIFFRRKVKNPRNES